MAETLSDQAQATLRNRSPVYDFIATVESDMYHPTDNPQGIIDLCRAENKVCGDLLQEKIRSIAAGPEEPALLYYGREVGSDGFRLTMKNFLEKKFNAKEELDVNRVFISNGVTALLESAAFAFANPGDYIMVPAPYYYRILEDFGDRPGVLVLGVPLTYSSDDAPGYARLETSDLENVYQAAINQGKRVRAILIINPTNPTGDILDARQLTNILDFANTYKLHVISNEIYGLSVYGQGMNFTSILSLPHPDPDRVHFMWGVSKDFGLSGYRCGVMYTRNPAMVKYLNATGNYHRPVGLIDKRLKELLDDEEWLDKVFFPTMKRRMNERFQYFRESLEKYGVVIHPSSATFFKWINLGKYLPEASFAGEAQLVEQLFQARLYMIPGGGFYHSEPGWFRALVSVDQPVFQEAVKRLTDFLKKHQDKNV